MKNIDFLIYYEARTIITPYLCFMVTISSLVSPRIFSARLRSRTERLTSSSSLMPHWIVAGEIGRITFPAAAAAAAAAADRGEATS